MEYKQGEKVSVIYKYKYKKKNTTKKGTIAGITDKFVIVQFKQYKECFLIKDIETGLVKIEKKVKAA
ncbi:hypothetical protein [Abyssisolibacter fermentans]|uniref:hypothetical protein n=1 Tax=Abyssisolibacter fermentans TaxID=1766203 RepID=UPI00082C364D|nr:hypothetical protein [Abyssisolibacter fermentans]